MGTINFLRKRLKRKLWGLALSVGGFFIIIIIIIVFFAGGAISEESNGGDCSNDSTSSSVSIKGSNGAWTQKGTKAYNTAKAIFNFLVHKEGFSGAGAAGVVAVVNRESGFNPSISNPAGGVVGLFQWGGWNGDTRNSDRIHSGGIIHSSKDLTVSKELKLLDYELHHGYERARSTVGRATDPKKAAEQWSLLYEGVSLSDGQTKIDQIHGDAERAYRLFGGSKFKAKGSLLGSGSKTAKGSSSEDSGDDECDDDAIGNGGPILSQAKHLIGYFTYGAHGGSGYGGWKHPNKNGQTDCSGFVWLCMKRAGYDVGNDAFSTPDMERDARGPHKYLKQISPKNAKPGDVIIMNVGAGYGASGHTAVIAGKYHGYQTKIIEMGGDNNGHVHTSNIHDSFLSLIPNARITWARPVKRK